MKTIRMLANDDGFIVGSTRTVPDRQATLLIESGKAVEEGHSLAIEQNMQSVPGIRAGMYGGRALRNSVPKQ